MNIRWRKFEWGKAKKLQVNVKMFQGEVRQLRNVRSLNVDLGQRSKSAGMEIWLGASRIFQTELLLLINSVLPTLLELIIIIQKFLGKFAKFPYRFSQQTAMLHFSRLSNYHFKGIRKSKRILYSQDSANSLQVSLPHSCSVDHSSLCIL